jgi:outer membrane protein OmpA-like peptidoglycan-associated protein
MFEPCRAFPMALILAAALPGGCALVSKERLDDCHKQCQNLQLETSQLKDVVLKLRATNQDLAHRNLQDSKQLKTLDEDNQQLERSVLAYQEDRDRLAAQFEQFKRQLAATSDRIPAAMLERFEDFARTHPGCTFAAGSRVATLPVEMLFAPGSAELTPAAMPLLHDCAAIFSWDDARDVTVRIVSDAADSSVRRTSLDPAPVALGAARAKRVREALIEQAMLDPAHVELAREPATEPADRAPANTARGSGRIVEIHLQPPDGATPAGPATTPALDPMNPLPPAIERPASASAAPASSTLPGEGDSTPPATAPATPEGTTKP